MNRDIAYIRQIIEAIDKIMVYTEDGKDVFFESLLIQDAVIRNMEVVGEVTKR